MRKRKSKVGTLPYIEVVIPSNRSKIQTYRAAKYYGYDTSDVAHYVGIYANNRHKEKGIRRE